MNKNTIKQRSYKLITSTIVFCVIFLTSSNLFSQDSLKIYKQQFNSEKIDSLKADHAFWLTEYYFPRNSDSADYYLTQSRKYTKPFTSRRANYYHGRGLLLLGKSEIIEAQKNLDSSLVIYKELNDTENLVSLKNNMAYLALNNNTPLLAKDLLYENYTLFKGLEKEGLSKRYQIDYVSTLNLLGKLYGKIGDTDKSLIYNTKAVEVAKNVRDTLRMLICQANVASSLVEFGDTTNAIKLLKENIKIKRIKEYTNHYGIEEYRLGEIYSEQGVKDSAEYFYEQALNLIEKYNPNAIPRPILMLEIGRIDLRNKNYGAAEKKCLEAYQFALEQNRLETQAESCNCLGKVYNALNQYKKAYVYHTEFMELKDKLSKNNLENELRKTEYQLQFAEKAYTDSLDIVRANNKRDLIIAKQESDIKSKNMWTIILLIATAVLLVFIYIIYKQKKETNQKKDLLAKALGEKEILLKEIHHRVKNNFQIISSLLNLQAYAIDDDSKTKPLKDAQNRIGSMALVHQKLYRSESLAQVEMNQYFTALIDALKVGFLPNDDCFELSIETNEIELELDKTIPIGLIVNEMITNSFKYGTSKDGVTRINLTLERVGEKLNLIYSDKGNGLPENFNREDLTSLGMELIEILSEQLEGELTIQNEGGLAFNITFAT